MAALDPMAFLFSTTLAGASIMFLMVLSRPGLLNDQTALYWWIAGDFAFLLHRVVVLIQPGVFLPREAHGPWLHTDLLLMESGGFMALGLACGITSLRFLCRTPFGPRLTTALLVMAPAVTMATIFCMPDRNAGGVAIVSAAILLTGCQMVVAWPGIARSRGLAILTIGNGLILLVLMVAVAGMVKEMQGAGGTVHAAAQDNPSKLFIPDMAGMMCDFVAAILRTFAILLVMQERQGAYITRLSTTDHLTGALNRRGAMPILQQSLHNASRHRRPVSVAMLDIDHFKRVNDRFGHEVGDQVLVAFADAIQGTKRACDLLVRWGGEEFLLMMPDTDLDGAVAVLERIRAELPARIAERTPCLVTFSAGVVSAFPGREPHALTDMFVKADLCLYQAKVTRDCIVAKLLDAGSNASVNAAATATPRRARNAYG